MATKNVQRGWRPLAILGVLALTSLTGCGFKGLPVSGTVTVDGQPLSQGIITFNPDASKGNTLRMNASCPLSGGRYTLQTSGITRSESGVGVPPGWYKVTWTPPDTGTKKHQEVIAKVNEKYTKVETTPLAVEVKENPEPGAYDFKLTK